MAPQASADCLSEAACYYRARYYDPSAGRFSSEDPIRYGGGINFYAFVQNHVLGESDPTGLQQRDQRCPSYFPDFLCNWAYGKPNPPKPDRNHPICPCTRKSAAPIGNSAACAYDCCPSGVYPDGSQAYGRRGVLVPMKTFKAKFPDQCKDLKDCPYQIMMQFDLSENRTLPVGVVTGIGKLEP